MAVHQTKKDTAEAKLQKLQAQLYGKQTAINSSGNFSFKANTDVPRINSTTQTSDISYLQQSLRKIFILSFLAVALQFLLFYLEQNHYINLNFLNLS